MMFKNVKTEIKRIGEIKQYYRNIMKARNDCHEEFIELTEEDMDYIWYSEGDDICAIIEVCEWRKAPIEDVYEKTKNIGELNNIWEIVSENIIVADYLANQMNDLLQDIKTGKSLEHREGGHYLSYMDCVKFTEILDLAYIYKCIRYSIRTNIEYFDMRAKKYSIYECIKDQINESKREYEEEFDLDRLEDYIEIIAPSVVHRVERIQNYDKCDNWRITI